MAVISHHKHQNPQYNKKFLLNLSFINRAVHTNHPIYTLRQKGNTQIYLNVAAYKLKHPLHVCEFICLVL